MTKILGIEYPSLENFDSTSHNEDELSFSLLYLEEKKLTETTIFQPYRCKAPWGIRVNNLLMARDYGSMTLIKSADCDTIQAFSETIEFKGKVCRLPTEDELKEVCHLNPERAFNEIVWGLSKALQETFPAVPYHVEEWGGYVPYQGIHNLFYFNLLGRGIRFPGAKYTQSYNRMVFTC